MLAKQLTTLERIQDCDFCVNGMEAVDKVIRVYENCVFGQETPEPGRLRRLAPIQLLMLDFQMPKLTGVQVVGAVRKYLKERNMSLKEIGIELQEPKIVFVTAFLSVGFRKHIAELGILNAYEKPLQLAQLKKILAVDAFAEDRDSAGVSDNNKASRESN